MRQILVNTPEFIDSKGARTCKFRRKATVCCKRVSGHPPACIFEGRVKWPLLSLFTLRMLNGVCIVHPV